MKAGPILGGCPYVCFTVTPFDLQHVTREWSTIYYSVSHFPNTRAGAQLSQVIRDPCLRLLCLT